MTNRKKWQVRLFFIVWLVFIKLFIKDSLFGFLLLNTFLGYIPIELSFHIGKPKQNVLIFWFLTIVWMLFYPNAPYILTDLLHLSWLHPNDINGMLKLDGHIWFLYTCLLISALTCAFLGFWSLIHVAKAITAKLHLQMAFTNMMVTCVLIFLSSVGLYIGRFLRVHTVYLITNPKFYMHMFANMWNREMLIFVILMTIIQLVIYWIYTIIQDNSPET
ncbi:DUF1361 domain-containing protein [Fructilactobacillus cliffordii]|uniref:DUF1361 domain-containing protein n=1 Tax=Fructilactobacillus cliffordii TaxID=2940299 RepID=A0A9Q8ZQI9_9LACO|nr:DUF1361 domain-containing protein [Fructilactobacillus cliffordii]USS86935.1 DUF1361 domain-containing protein [Fructilactobacillus cliffordii]USS88662.1 DUF1361 domain-containing protein [Fructilactobacillus cliffordii]